MAQYDAAKEIAAPVKRRARATALPDTWSWLCLRYFAECADYKRLDPRTQHVRRQILEATFDELIAAGFRQAVRRLPACEDECQRGRSSAGPQTRDTRSCERSHQGHASGIQVGRRKGYAPFNPAREVSYFKSGSEGFHTWTVDEVQQFEERHPIGTKARLALALLLYTGQRRSDVIRFGKQHAKRGKLTFTQYKGRNRKPHKLTLPILPALQKIIDASPCGDMTFLVNDLGSPFTDAGFGNKFRDWCDQADLPQCSAHGLRKAGATSQQTTARPRINSWRSSVGIRSRKRRSTRRRPTNSD